MGIVIITKNIYFLIKSAPFALHVLNFVAMVSSVRNIIPEKSDTFLSKQQVTEVPRFGVAVQREVGEQCQ